MCDCVVVQSVSTDISTLQNATVLSPIDISKSRLFSSKLKWLVQIKMLNNYRIGTEMGL